MRRPAIIIIVLIALVAIIGVDRIDQGIRFLISDNRLVRPQEARRDLRPHGSSSESSRAKDQQDPRDSSRAEHRVGSPGVAGTLNEHGDSQAIAVSVTGERSPIHFVRASTIFGTSEPTEEQITLLREAVAVVGEELRPNPVIFEADGISTSQAPAIVFARDAFDLTAQVKAIYDALDKTSNHSHDGIPKVHPGPGE